MATETREIEISGVTYLVTQLPAKKGQALLVRLVKLLGPGVGSFVGGLGRGAEDTDSAIALGVGDAIHDLAARLNEAEVGGVLEEFAKRTTVVKSEDVHVVLSSIYDDHFAGAYDQLMVWARFCLEVNYRSFFAGQSGAEKPLNRLWKLLQALPSRHTSAGTSTASRPAAATPQA
jgi:hypothetical protein